MDTRPTRAERSSKVAVVALALGVVVCIGLSIALLFVLAPVPERDGRTPSPTAVQDQDKAHAAAHRTSYDDVYSTTSQPEDDVGPPSVFPEEEGIEAQPRPDPEDEQALLERALGECGTFMDEGAFGKAELA